MPYDEAEPALPAGVVAEHLRQPRLPVVPGRAALPPDRRAGQRRRPAVHSGTDFPKSHSAYWELGPGLGCDRDRVHLERVEPLTVREARRLGFEARKAPVTETRRERRPDARPARRGPPQGWKLAAAESSTATHGRRGVMRPRLRRSSHIARISGPARSTSCSAARLPARGPWLCVPASRRVCHCRSAGVEADVDRWREPYGASDARPSRGPSSG